MLVWTKEEGADARSLSKSAPAWKTAGYGQVANAFVSWIGANATPCGFV
jgi:hypothetical protein